MQDIVALAMNPSIDVSTSVDRVVPIHKLRCAEIRRDPGGGGINVARVLRRFGVDITAVYPVGGAIGRLLRQQVDNEGIRSCTIPIAEETRESFTVYEETSGQQYRFVLPGPHLSKQEWQACLEALAAFQGPVGCVVASGSLPPAMPRGFFARMVRMAKTRGARLVLDTSGPALKEALAEGVYLVKPNLRELGELFGSELKDEDSWIAACRELVSQGKATIVALTLGDLGALLVTRDRVWRARAVPIKPLSAVGAGDSFLGAMIWRLSEGDELPKAFRYGVAAGTAALLTPGTELSRREDVERLNGEVTVREISVPRRAVG